MDAPFQRKRASLPEGLHLRADGTTNALLAAAARGDATAVAALLDAGVNPNPPRTRLGSDWGALARAAYHGRRVVVRLLIQRGEDPNRRENGIPVLSLAANRGRLSVVSELIASGADVHARSTDACFAGWTALHYAVSPDGSIRGHLRVVRALLRGGANVDARDDIGRTPLMGVCNGDWQVLDALVRAGADINARDEDDWTPLMLATNQNHPDNIGALLQHGADINARNRSGQNALAYVQYPQAVLTAQHLFREGLRMTAADRDAAITRSDECHRLLVDALRRTETQD